MLLRFLWQWTDSAVIVPTTEGLEYSLIDDKLHHTLPDDKLHYELPDNKLHYSSDD